MENDRFTEQKILRLKKDVRLPSGIEFKKNQEIEVVASVVYVNGYPIQFEANHDVLVWIEQNPSLFLEDFRRFK
jgi:hypothetical protein